MATSIQKLASILKQYGGTSAGLEQELNELLDIHKAEAVELQTARDDIETLKDAYRSLGARLSVLEQRDTDFDAVIDEALSGFTGQTGEGALNLGGPIDTGSGGEVTGGGTDSGDTGGADVSGGGSATDSGATSGADPAADLTVSSGGRASRTASAADTTSSGGESA